MSIGSDLGDSILGSTRPACLVVYDCRKMQQSVNDKLEALPKTQKAKKKAVRIQQATARILNSTTAMQSKCADDDCKKFEVQFNPNQLALYTRAAATAKSDLQNPEHSAKDSCTTPTVELSLTLYFDHVNLQDAFMWDKFTAGASVAAVGNIVSGIRGLVKEDSPIAKVWSVQPEVEGLISALRNPYTRTISFQWAKFSFSGFLENVNAQYTMFSTSGRPIRATVYLRLKQNLSTRELTAWRTDFDKLFSDEGMLKNSAASAVQSIGNLVNLTL